jgi:hypothetical protein
MSDTNIRVPRNVSAPWQIFGSATMYRPICFAVPFLRACFLVVAILSLIPSFAASGYRDQLQLLAALRFRNFFGKREPSQPFESFEIAGCTFEDDQII